MFEVGEATGIEAEVPVGVPSRCPPFFFPNRNAIALKTGGRRAPELFFRTRERRREVVVEQGMQSSGSEYHVVAESLQARVGLVEGGREAYVW